jgi:hypothetical protein
LADLDNAEQSDQHEPCRPPKRRELKAAAAVARAVAGAKRADARERARLARNEQLVSKPAGPRE